MFVVNGIHSQMNKVISPRLPHDFLVLFTFIVTDCENKFSFFFQTKKRESKKEQKGKLCIKEIFQSKEKTFHKQQEKPVLEKFV